MPFDRAALEKGLFDMMENNPSNYREAAQRISRAYADFVKPATGAGSKATFTGLEVAAMTNLIASSLRANGALPAVVRGVVQGVQAFWLAPPVTFGAAVTTAWTGQALLTAGLLSFVNLRISRGVAARKLVGYFEAATRLVFVQPPGPVSPVPIA